MANKRVISQTYVTLQKIRQLQQLTSRISYFCENVAKILPVGGRATQLKRIVIKLDRYPAFLGENLQNLYKNFPCRATPTPKKIFARHRCGSFFVVKSVASNPFHPKSGTWKIAPKQATHTETPEITDAVLSFFGLGRLVSWVETKKGSDAVFLKNKPSCDHAKSWRTSYFAFKAEFIMRLITVFCCCSVLFFNRSLLKPAKPWKSCFVVQNPENW